MFALVGEPPSRGPPRPGAGHWQVRDVVRAPDRHDRDLLRRVRRRPRRQCSRPPLVPLVDMATHVDEGAQQFRTLERDAAIDRLRVATSTDAGVIEEPHRRGVGRSPGPAQVHGPAAGVLLPGLPARRLRGAQLGHPRRAPAVRTLWKVAPPTCLCRSASCCGRRRRKVRRGHRPMELGVRITSGPTPATRTHLRRPGGADHQPRQQSTTCRPSSSSTPPASC